MDCFSPSLSLPEGVSISLPVAARVGLRMDGVMSLLEVNTSISIYADPQVERFEDLLVFGQNDEMILTIRVR